VQSVSELYQLQRGFAAAGLSASDLPTALFMMQKSLGGVNELGERSEDIFQRLHLSLSQLKTMSAPDQFNAVLNSISKLGQSDAAKAASGIRAAHRKNRTR
jgi:hypothetical protein